MSEDPADRVTLDESVSYALLTVLEQLSPAERTAFVLHDVFDVPFGDVAEVVGRSPEAVRQLASRARRHVKRERPRVAASRDEHDRTVRAFAQAVTEGDLEAPRRGTRPGRRLDLGRRRPRDRLAQADLRRRAGRAGVGGAQPQGHAPTDRDRAQRPPRPAAPEPRRSSRRALPRRQQQSHHTDRCGPQPGEAAPLVKRTPRRWNEVAACFGGSAIVALVPQQASVLGGPLIARRALAVHYRARLLARCAHDRGRSATSSAGRAICETALPLQGKRGTAAFRRYQQRHTGATVSPDRRYIDKQATQTRSLMASASRQKRQWDVGSRTCSGTSSLSSPAWRVPQA